MKTLRLLFALALFSVGRPALAEPLAGFGEQTLVSSRPSDAGWVDPTLRDAWGIAIRPTEKGVGGHFWISSAGNGTSNQYLGDVSGSPLVQDALVNMDVPPWPAGYSPPSPSGPETFVPDGVGVSRPTGQTWQQTPGFVVTLPHHRQNVTNPAKFLFATEDGMISAWTDNKEPDGTPNWVGYSVPVINRVQDGSRFYGITVSNESGYLYVADLGVSPGIRVFNPDFSERGDFGGALNPFAGDDGVQPGEFTPFNVQTLHGNGAGNLFVTYVEATADPANVFATGASLGRLAEYTPAGELVGAWDDHGLLNAPYGLALAPADFGLASDLLLVGNAGDGTIVAFDPTTRAAVDYLRAADGSPVTIEGLKGLTFGNGVSLGDANALYFTGGPSGGREGVFGKVIAVPEPSAHALAALAATFVGVSGFKRRSGLGSSIARGRH